MLVKKITTTPMQKRDFKLVADESKRCERSSQVKLDAEKKTKRKNM